MSSLLSIERVSKTYPNGPGEIVVLDDVSFEVGPGAQVGVYGPARSGKSTLLRIAVGIERADSGSVSFEGRPLARMRTGARARLLRRSVGYLALGDWHPCAGEEVLDHLVTALGSDGFTAAEARRKAVGALEAVGLERDSRSTVSSLSVGDRSRLALARAVVREPRLLVVDEPALMPSVQERERFGALLRRISRERGMALLSASAEMAALQGMDVFMSLSRGGLRSSHPRREATVLQLPTRRTDGGDGDLAPTAEPAR